MTPPAQSTPPAGPHAALTRQASLQALTRLLITVVAPLLVYLLLRPHLHSDLTALIIGAAIPIVSAAAKCKPLSLKIRFLYSASYKVTISIWCKL
jgi:hypothetical protein